MKSLYKDIREKWKSLPAEKQKEFLDDVAKLLAVRPYGFRQTGATKGEGKNGPEKLNPVTVVPRCTDLESN
jgi:hypothetical protein